MDITNYPILQATLIDTIPKHVYGDLQKFNIYALPFVDRRNLMFAYRDDVAEDVLQDLVSEKLCLGDVAGYYKADLNISSLIDNIAQEAIYDIAQEMGSTLREIQRNNHIADRTDER